MGGLDGLRTKAAEIVIALVIGEDQNDVEGRCAGAQETTGEEYEKEFDVTSMADKSILASVEMGGPQKSVLLSRGVARGGISFLLLNNPSITGN